MDLSLPDYYWKDDFSEFESLFKAYGVLRRYSSGELMYGTGIFSCMSYVVRGLARFFVLHASGKEKTIYYAASGSCCVMYSPPGKYKMENDANQVQAVTDVIVIEVPQPKVREMLFKHQDFHLRMTETYVKFVNLLLFQQLDSAYNSILQRVINFLYLCYAATGERTLTMGQESIASTIGASRINVSKAISILKEDGVIATGRNSTTIVDLPRLVSRCSYEARK